MASMPRTIAATSRPCIRLNTNSAVGTMIRADGNRCDRKVRQATSSRNVRRTAPQASGLSVSNENINNRMGERGTNQGLAPCPGNDGNQNTPGANAAAMLPVRNRLNEVLLLAIPFNTERSMHLPAAMATC